MLVTGKTQGGVAAGQIAEMSPALELGKLAWAAADGGARFRLNLAVARIEHESAHDVLEMAAHMSGATIPRSFDNKAALETVLAAIGAVGLDAFISACESRAGELSMKGRRYDSNAAYHRFGMKLATDLDGLAATKSEPVDPASLPPARTSLDERESALRAAPALAQAKGITSLTNHNQKDVEQSPSAFRALCDEYGLDASAHRLSWTGSIDLRRSDSPTVATAAEAVKGIRGGANLALVTDINELRDPDIVAKLVARGFTTDRSVEQLLALAGDIAGARAVSAQRQRVSLVLNAIDDEGGFRVRRDGVKSGPSTQFAMKDKPVEPFKRAVQSIQIDYDASGKIESAYLLTYSWPRIGQPGMNEENVSFYKDGAPKNLLMNTSLQHCVSISMGAAMGFDPRFS